MQAPVEEQHRFQAVAWHAIRRGGVWVLLELACKGLSQCCVTLAVVIIVGDLQKRQLSLRSYLVLFTTIGLSLSAMSLARRLAMVRRRKLTGSSPSAGEGPAKYRYVLYLRPFGEDRKLFDIDPEARVGNLPLTLLPRIFGWFSAAAVDSDATWEERVVRIFCRFGKVVAGGNPFDPEPFPGAERFDLPEKGWEPRVTKAVRRARLVLIVAGIDSAAGSAAGTLWEYTEAVRLLEPSRLVLLVCGDTQEYDRFRAGAEAAFAQRAGEFPHLGRERPRLPDCPGLHRPKRLRRPHPLRGLIWFDELWTAEFVRFDPTRERGLTEYRRWRATLRHQIAPVMACIEERLPGTAVVTDTKRKGIVERLSPTYLSMAWTTSILWPLSAGFTMWQRLALVVSSVVFPLGYHRLERVDVPSHTRAGLEVRLSSDKNRSGEDARRKTRTAPSPEWGITQQWLIGNSVLALAGFIGIMLGAYIKGEPRPLHNGSATFIALAVWSAWTAVRIRLSQGAACRSD
ncbi:hypothetical protein AB5J52_01125 [Streptomyces sp. R39]|uniref:Uncharacterized protein n=1 Tax=Streptomyces sp. R39 TaxID=3238631 RepID=A0AB39QCE4_9ACTN